MSASSGMADFNLSLALCGRKARQRSKAEIAAITLNLFSKIVAQTPVDTGVARSNWNLSVGSEDSSFSTDRKSPEPALEKAAVDVQTLDLGDEVYITNATSYIRKLEEGSSKQAPSGWVKVAVEQTRRRLK